VIKISKELIFVVFEALRYKIFNGTRAFRCWVVPWFNSLRHKDALRPVLSYLYVGSKCNIDCHYCFDYDNTKPWMTWETAKDSVDWLKSVGCRVLAFMGGEPLMKKDLILKTAEYARKQGFFVYLPTNGYLLTPDFVDKAGSNIAVYNVALDAVTPTKELPKGLLAIDDNLRHLVKKQQEYGYVVMFNINITSKNMKDVKLLTEIAAAYGIAVDYHINEPPQLDQPHFKHMDHDLCITPDKYEEADKLFDWLIEKSKEGLPMVNSIDHLNRMRDFMRGEHKPWKCRAGQNGLAIRSDGTIVPCFGKMASTMDWGTVWNPKFDKKRLDAIKEKCNKGCFSTCFYQISYYYEPTTIMHWWKKYTMVSAKK
jgi:MoaA/NifB/PqqE/SkfB family radical SAM enzyme